MPTPLGKKLVDAGEPLGPTRPARELDAGLFPGETKGSIPAGSDARHLVKASATVTAFGLFGKVLGIAREALVAATFGANRAMDGFYVARVLPDMFSTWIEGPVTASLVPVFSKRLHQQGEESAWKVLSNIVNTLALGLILIIVVLYFGSGVLVRLVSVGFRSPEAWQQSARLAQILAIAVFFSVLGVVLGTVQNIYRRQHLPALGRNANTFMVVVAVLLLGPTLGLTGYALGILAGAGAMFVLQSGILWLHRRFYRLSVDPRAPEIREMAKLALPLFIGLAGTRLDWLVDMNFASFLPPGHLSIGLFAAAIAVFATDLVVNTSEAVLMPHFAQLAAGGRYDAVRHRLTQALGGYLLFMMPVSVFLCVGARPVVDLLYQRGRFGPEEAALTALVVPILAVAAPAYAASHLLAQVYFSTGDTRTPVKVGFWRIGFKLLLSVALVPLFGLLGLMAASSAATFFRLVLLWRRLEPSLRPDVRLVGSMIARITTAALAGGIVAFVLFAALPAFPGGFVGQTVRLLVVALVAMTLHFASAWLVGENLVRQVVRTVLVRYSGRALKT